jgi:hypothetical protein
MIPYIKRRKSSLLLLLFLFQVSCLNSENKFSYAIYYENNVTPSHYLVKKIKHDRGLRIIKSYKVTANNHLEQMELEKFELVDGGLIKVISKNDTVIKKPYLTIKNNDCVKYTFDNAMVDETWSTNICFINQEDLYLGDVIYRNALKFKKIMGGIESFVYYDSNFILIKEEYVAGYTDSYRIIRIDTIISNI